MANHPHPVERFCVPYGLNGREIRQTSDGDYVLYDDYKAAIDALRLMCEARDSYNNEFNPGSKIKDVADWSLINTAWCAADAVLARA
jgi:hypothetical protein